MVLEFFKLYIRIVNLTECYFEWHLSLVYVMNNMTFCDVETKMPIKVTVGLSWCQLRVLGGHWSISVSHNVDTRLCQLHISRANRSISIFLSIY